MKKKNLTGWIFVVSILFIVLVMISILWSWKWLQELFYQKYPIDFYVMTMGNQERLENIQKQEDFINKTSKTPIKIEIVEAVNGYELDIEEMLENKTISIKENIQSDMYRTWHKDMKVMKPEVGCYLSHKKIYDIIQKKGNKGYSVIFEDDVVILTDNLIEDIHTALQVIENTGFDILYLGANSSNPEFNQIHGEFIKENVYKLNENSLAIGTYAMLFNNQNISKIIKETDVIDMPMDDKYQELLMHGKLKMYLIYPNIVSINEDIKSTINVIDDNTY